MKAATATPRRSTKPLPPHFGASLDAVIEAAARLLGADAESATHIRASSILVAAGMPVLMLKVPAMKHLVGGLMLCLDTGTPVPESRAASTALLQQAAGLLLARAVGVGATDEQNVALFRFLPLRGLTPQRLAEEILSLRDMAAVAAPAEACGAAGAVERSDA